MNRTGRSVLKFVAAIVLGASVVSAVAALVVTSRRIVWSGGSSPVRSNAEQFAATDDPISAEADVFRTKASVLAIDPALETRRNAHPRTLATYRALRAYPGAPPRVPHGLTPIEVLKGGCTTCHERGGYSHRFDAYVPVTPHPEMGICLQCHVGDAKLMAIPLPSADPSARCRQCHAQGSLRWRDSSTTWKPLPWPALARVVKDVPPPIPHTLESRGNCVACHAAPAAVQEIRTPHADRANCRQCHLESNGDTAEYVRPPARLTTNSGGMP